MQKTVLLLFIIFPLLAYSQININKTKAEIKKEIAKFKKSTPAFSVTVSETDSTLTTIKTEANKNKEEALLNSTKRENADQNYESSTVISASRKN
ncbi:MAG: hypothetical protein IPL04_11475 [Chitinophagaceae bacterium]|nr:hypothetical protein [Chitinophagaceae bacterium]